MIPITGFFGATGEVRAEVESLAIAAGLRTLVAAEA
jgi:hypothetical protein